MVVCDYVWCLFELQASQILTYKGFHYVYYECGRAKHDRWQAPYQIYLARFVEGRLAGQVPESSNASMPAVLTTKSFVWPERGRLFVDIVKSSPTGDGKLTTELFHSGSSGQPMALFDSAYAIQVGADHGKASGRFATEVKWKCGHGCISGGKRVHIKFRWTGATLFGFDLRE
jgi:hypothetical protein